jgi:hypothetical protein
MHGSADVLMRQLCFTSLMAGLSITIRFTRTRPWTTARRASLGDISWKARPRTRSALGVDRMAAQCPRMRSGQARQPRPARRRAASGLTRAQPWTNRKNQTLSDYSGATTAAHSRGSARLRRNGGRTQRAQTPRWTGGALLKDEEPRHPRGLQELCWPYDDRDLPEAHRDLAVRLANGIPRAC